MRVPAQGGGAVSYVRWSTKVRKGCATCGDTGYVPDEEGPGGRSLCRSCTSCWYVFWDVGGYITAHHACKGGGDEEPTIPFDSAMDRQPPADCPMGDVALEAVHQAHADWVEAGRPEGRAL